MTLPESELQDLRLNSRIKHLILQEYLSVWEYILGAYHGRIIYVDCYAGPGSYRWENNTVDGSPIIAINTASAWLKEKPSKEMVLVFIENDETQQAALEKSIQELTQIPNPDKPEPKRVFKSWIFLKCFVKPLYIRFYKDRKIFSLHLYKN